MFHWRHFRGHSSVLVAHTQPPTRKGTYPVVQDLLGMYNIHMHCTAHSFQDMYWQERRKKTNDIEIFTFVFSI